MGLPGDEPAFFKAVHNAREVRRVEPKPVRERAHRNGFAEGNECPRLDNGQPELGGLT